MAMNLPTCHPGEGFEVLNRLSGLVAPLLQIDFERELQQLRQEESRQRESGRSSKTLAKYPDFRIVLILMKSGGTPNATAQSRRTDFHSAIERTVRIHLADRKVTLRTGHLLVLDCEVLHDIEALEQSALLLTISWRRQKRDGP
jgi:mannose-6-phosphate isomerase-like protein (cupin superfamily)